MRKWWQNIHWQQFTIFVVLHQIPVYLIDMLAKLESQARALNKNNNHNFKKNNTSSESTVE